MNQAVGRSQRFVCLVSMLALLAGASPLCAMPVEHITSPRPSGWVVDYTGSLSPETRQEIDRLGDKIHAANGAEVVVVVIDSTDGEPSRDFAIRLFNHWGLDLGANGRAILLFAALGDRSAELVLGRGLDTPANNQASESIMQGEMVPRFRAGDPGGALLEGARASSRLLLGLDVAPLPAETATPMPPRPDARPQTQTPAEAIEPAPARSRPRPSGGLFLALLAGAGLAGGGYYLLMRSRRCDQCRIPMTLLDEQQDDAHLAASERTEEQIGSVDHEIWLCPQCGATKKKSWLRHFSGHGRCASCGTRAAQSTSLVIENPTYTSSGTRRVDTSCAHCGHRTSQTFVVPPLERPRESSSRRSSSTGRGLFSSSSSSSRSSSSSSSSSSGSRSSSGSTSRSSGGGGSSRGGASGKW